MSVVKCFDAVSIVTDAANRKFGKSRHINASKENVLRDDCYVLDKLAEESSGISFEVFVNEASEDITISLTCGELGVSIDSDSHPIYDLLSHAKLFTMDGKPDGSAVTFSFVFPGIWDKV